MRENAEKTRPADESFATAFTLLHGNPPKALMWRGGGFWKRDPKAIQYCRDLEAFLVEQMPGIKRQRLVIRRNRVLRIIFLSLGHKDPNGEPVQGTGGEGTQLSLLREEA